MQSRTSKKSSLPGISSRAPGHHTRRRLPGARIASGDWSGYQFAAFVATLLPLAEASGPFTDRVGNCNAGASEDIAWYSRAVGPFGWLCLKDGSAEVLVNAG